MVLLLIHFLSCWFMAGVICIVQWVHYPGFDYVEAERFVEFENFHTTRISGIVMPAMLIELSTAAGLLYVSGLHWVFILNLGLLGLIWLSTFFLSVPCHSALASGKNPEIISRLVRTNAPRTVLWPLREGCCCSGSC